jgi:chromosome partitioning protein
MECGKNHYTMASTLGTILKVFSWFRPIRTGGPNVSRVITIANNKGGTGKTTTAVNLASGLAFLKGYRVLLIDFDPQGNASISLNVDIETLDWSVKDLLTGKMLDLNYLLWDKGDQLKILPANNSLKSIENELFTAVNGRVRLKSRLMPILDDFDYIIIDTPPTTGIFTQSPLIASDEVIIPVDVGYFSLQGIRQLLEEMEQIQEHYNPELKIAGILLTKFDSRTVLSKQVEAALRKNFNKLTFKTVIRVNVDIIRSQIDRKSIFAFDRASSGAADYEQLIDELVGDNVVKFPAKRRLVSAAAK